MKKALFFLIIVLGYYSFGQNKIMTDSILKSGIYLTADDIANNLTVDLPNLKVIKHTIEYGTTLNGLKSMDAYSLDVSKEQEEKIGSILGFSDGKDIYLSYFSPSYSRVASFYKVEKIGHFLYFEGIEEINLSNLNWRDSCQNLFDLNKRERISKLTNGKFKKIISDNDELLKKFEKERRKYLLYKKYLKEYSE
jgi:hypothetical protein